MCSPPRTGHPLVSQSTKPTAVLLPASSLPVAAQPASSTCQHTESIAHPITSMCRIAIGSSVEHILTVPLQGRHLSPITAPNIPVRKSHAPDPAPPVWPIWSAHRGHSCTGGARDFLSEGLALRKEDVCPSTNGTWHVKEASAPSILRLTP